MASLCSGWCKKDRRKSVLRRGTTYKIFGDKNVMTKVDLHSKNQIIDEALEKLCHVVVIDSTKQEYIFEDYASRIYKNIRRVYDVKDSDFQKCFGSKAIPDLDVKISAGKGGAFFVKNLKHSHLLIKSITPGEYEIFKQFTDKYYMYLLHNPKTLLTPIFGVFTLALSDDNEIPDIHFIVMKSVFDPNLVAPHQKMVLFDLKGSEHGRKTLESKDYNKLKDMRTCPKSLLKETVKDIDFKNTLESLQLEDSDDLKTQIAFDAAFLSKNNFMDYSLLMFIVYDYGKSSEDPDEWVKVNKDNKEEEKQLQDSRLPATNNISSFYQKLKDKNGYEYERHIYFGIIDYLTSFNFMKRFEEQFRQTYASNSSCVAPEKYAKRFVDFMDKVIGGGL